LCLTAMIEFKIHPSAGSGTVVLSSEWVPNS
jgi:hypothetical protein